MTKRVQRYLSMTAIISKDVFSARWSLVVFVAYIFFGMCHGLLITASRAASTLDTNAYDYNTITVILLVNLVKLVASGAFFIYDYGHDDPILSMLRITRPNAKHSHNNGLTPTNNNNDEDNHRPHHLQHTDIEYSPSSLSTLYLDGFWLLLREISKNRRLLFYFFIPAALYTTYDNLMFVSLSVFTPTTYNILAQCRIVITAVVFERLFHRRLSGIQWLSLFCLTIGCVVKELYHHLYTPSSQNTKEGRYLTHEYLLALGCIGIQIICSCFANVYTEFLFKDKDSRAHPMVENVFMYCDNIFCSLIVLLSRGQLWGVFSYSSLQSVFKMFVVAIIINQAILGLITATFLRKLNSIVKSFATAIELVFTPFVCWVLFGHQIDVCTVLALCIVCVASCVYATNPLHIVKVVSAENNNKIVA